MSTGGLEHDMSPDMPTEPAEMQAASPRAAARALLGVGGMEVSMGHQSGAMGTAMASREGGILSGFSTPGRDMPRSSEEIDGKALREVLRGFSGLEKMGIKVPIFSGGDINEWFEWKEKFITYLRVGGLGHLVRGGRGVIAPEENNAFFTVLSSHTAGSANSRVRVAARDRMDGMASWSALCHRYEGEINDIVDSKYRVILNARLKEGDDPDGYILKITDAVQTLYRLRHPLEDHFVIRSMMEHLPQDYAAFVTSMGVLDKPDFVTFCLRLRHYYKHAIKPKKKSTPAPPTRNEKAFATTDSEEAGGTGRVVACWRCKEPGHKRFECPLKNKANKTDGKADGKTDGKTDDKTNGKTDDKASVKVGKDGKKHVNFVIKDGEHEQAWAADGSADVESMFLLDSGSSMNIVTDKKGLRDLRPVSKEVMVGGKNFLRAEAIGTFHGHMTDSTGATVTVKIPDVAYIPDFGQCILSTGRMEERGVGVNFNPKLGPVGVRVGDVHFPIVKVGVMKFLDLKPSVEEESEEQERSFPTQVSIDSLWHGRLCHVHHGAVKVLAKLGLVPSELSKVEGCAACVKGKQTARAAPKKSESRASAPLDLVHTDPLDMGCVSREGYKYGLIFTDDYSRWREIYFLRHKSEALAKFKEFCDKMRARTGGKKVKGLRTDNAKEYLARDFKDYCVKAGIWQQFSGEYAPQQNGVAERTQRTVTEMVRTLLEDTGLSKMDWPVLASLAVYELNLLPTKALSSSKVPIPFYHFFGKMPKLDHLRTPGCSAHVKLPDRERGKLNAKSVEGVLVGYDESNRHRYHIMDPVTGDMRKSVHVVFHEHLKPARDLLAASGGGEPEGDMVSEGELSDGVTSAGSSDDDRSDDEASGDSDEGSDVPSDAKPPDDEVSQGSEELSGDESLGGAGLDGDVSSDDAAKTRSSRRLNKKQRHKHASERAVRRESTPVGAGESGGPGSVGADEGDDAPRKSTRTRAVRAPRMEDFVYRAVLSHMSMEQVFVALDKAAGDPSTFTEALRSSEAKEWRDAMDKEIKSLRDNMTFEVVKRPRGKHVIKVKWCFKRKKNELGQVVRHKARVVAKGFTQVQGRDFKETFAPVPNITCMRLVLALAALKNWFLQSMDVETAFLQAPMEEEIYVEQPEGYKVFDPGGEELVWRLRRSLYGLRQSSRNWHRAIDKWMRSYGFKPSRADPCVYVMGSEGTTDGILIVVLYVDDLSIAGSNLQTIERFKKAISRRFAMKDLGELKWMLGFEVVRDRGARTIEIKQSAYFDQVLERFGMENCKPVSTPAEGILRRAGADQGAEVNDREYMSIVGCLIYASIITRPDLAYAVQSLCRHMSAVTQEHRVAAKRVLRYLRGTKDMGIKFGVGFKAGSAELVGFSDSDYACDLDSRKSTTGYLFMLNGGPVCWSSRLQSTVAKSSAEAEYMAMSDAAGEAMYLRQLLKDLGYRQRGPTTLHEDNQGAIAMGENSTSSGRTKHIDVRYHYTREKIEKKKICLEYVPTQDQLADILTKPLQRVKLVELRRKVAGYE